MTKQHPEVDISINRFARKIPLTDAKIVRIVETVWCESGASAAEINIAIVGDRRMAAIAEQYAGRRYRTDVFSFDLTDSGDEVLSFEVIINAALARERAERLRTRADSEMAMYLIHGLLHLLGYDDATIDDARRMHTEALRLLEMLKFPVSAALQDLANHPEAHG